MCFTPVFLFDRIMIKFIIKCLFGQPLKYCYTDESTSSVKKENVFFLY